MKRMLIRMLGLAAGVVVTVSPAAEPEVDWPREWTAFGPVRVELHPPSFAPTPADLLPGDRLKRIPRELMIGTNCFQGVPMAMSNGCLDLAACARSPADGNLLYLLAPVRAAADTTVRIGAGGIHAWMQWWLDGRPVYSAKGRYVKFETQVSARDHGIELELARGEHVLAVAVLAAETGFSLAVTGPRNMLERPLDFRAAMDAGARKYKPPHWSLAIPYAAARDWFGQALEAASSDEERAEAWLALADNVRLDIWGAGPASSQAIRRHAEAVLALPGARAGQKARAALNLGEACLLEDDGAAARESFERAASLSAEPGPSNAAQLGIARAYIQEKNHEAARPVLERLSAAPGLDRTTAFQARLYRAALDLAPRLRPDHPRLFFNADSWPTVKARIEADPDGVRALRQAAGELPDTFEVRAWDEPLMQAALLYRLTGEPALLAKVRGMLRATLDHFLRLEEYNSYLAPRVYFLAALDWTWNELPDSERNGLVRDLLRFAYGWHMQQVAFDISQADGMPWYYMPGMHWTVGLVALSREAAGVEYARALTSLGRGYDNHAAACFAPNHAVLLADRGTRALNLEYNFSSEPPVVWTFLHCWQSAVGPVPGEWAFGSGFAPSCILRHALGFGAFQRTEGIRYCFRHFGYEHAWGGWMPGEKLFNNLEQFIHFFADCQPDEAAIAAHLLKVMRQAGCRGTGGSYPIEPYLLSQADAPPPRLPDGLPLARHYAQNGVVLMSSGFDPARSTYALYSCGAGAVPGRHRDAGHFTVFRRGYLALDSGTRAQQEGVDTFGDMNSGFNYAFQSVAHNTLLIHMPGERFKGRRGDLPSNSGGQREPPSAARLLAFESHPRFAYAATDLTPTYHSNKCERATRQFLFLAPDTFVVFDRVTARQAEYPKTWLLHTANEPVIAGREVRADHEQGRLFCRTLLPADAVLEPVGGPGREFWADGRNWPIPENSPYLRQMDMTSAADVPQTAGRWRIEVKPGQARKEDVFLHVIQASDQTVEAMADCRLREAEGRIELDLSAGGAACELALHVAGDVGGHLALREAGRVLVDRPLTGTMMPQDGLALQH